MNPTLSVQSSAVDWTARVKHIQTHLARIFPLNNKVRYKDANTLGIHRFLKQLFRTDPHGRYNKGSGNIDPKSFGSIVHAQVAAWTEWTPSDKLPTYQSFLDSCMPQVRQLIDYFCKKKYVGIASNVVVGDPMLNYSTPVDILMVPTKHEFVNSDFVFLVELKTTHTLFNPGSTPFLYPISEHLHLESPENFASLQAALPAVRMNEVLAADPVLKRLGKRITVLPLVVVIRMDNNQCITKPEESAVARGIQQIAFRDKLAAYLPKIKKETENYRRNNPKKRIYKRK